VASPCYPEKVVSGGQTGVDRAALDVALAQGPNISPDRPDSTKSRLAQANHPEYRKPQGITDWR